MIKNKLTALDFVEHDSIAALRYLITLCEQNKVSGIVFAIARKNGGRRRPRPYFGVTGRMASNLYEAAGLASMMQSHATRQAIESGEE